MSRKYARKLIIMSLAFALIIFLLGINLHLSKPASSVNEFEVKDLKCKDLFNENTNGLALEEAKRWTESTNESSSSSELIEDVRRGCDDFIRRRKYFTQYGRHNKEERDFRIAFTIMVYKTARQVERLLRTIYRPWNYYCIHVDSKSDSQFFNAIDTLTNCLNGRFNNIVNLENRTNVTWGTMTTLEADLACMKSLYEKYKDWKYLINLTGQEFPLKTNSELVEILKAFKGANNIDGTYIHTPDEWVPRMKMPFPMIWYKGSTHITANRKFIEFIFESKEANWILNALEDAIIPDEQLFSTLNYNPQFRIPGSFVGNPDNYVPENYTRKFFMTRYKNWGEYSCESQNVVRKICIWGVGDLPKLVAAPHLFTNKFIEDFEPATIKCLEQWYYNKVEKEIRTGKVDINSAYYSSLPFVLHQFQP